MGGPGSGARRKIRDMNEIYGKVESDNRNVMASKMHESAIALLNQESSLEDRCAVGISLIKSGATVGFAVAQSGAPHRTLVERAKLEIPEDLKTVRIMEAEERILFQALEVWERATDKALEMLENDQLKSGDVIKLMQVARDTIATKLKWNAPLPPPPEPEKEKSVLEKILMRLESGQSLTVSKEATDEKKPYEIAEVVGK